MQRFIALAGLVVSGWLACPATLAATGPSSDGNLRVFETWLKARYGAYGCDEGPARFQNPIVDVAYPGRRFYYVLTYARGIPVPFRNALSLIAEVRADGDVRPLKPSTMEDYRGGLRRVRSAREARQFAAAVLILTLGDPGQRRWRVDEKCVTARRSRGRWVCAYAHDPNHISEVSFDREGLLSAVQCNVPPVP